MHTKVCPNCNGDGFYRLRRDQMHPLMNVAYARPIRQPVNATSDPLVDEFRSIVGWEFKCRPCRETGWINWTRGKSLSPVHNASETS